MDVKQKPISGAPLFPGKCNGPLLVVDAPLSFWGGVDPLSGQIIDPRHPNLGESITGTILGIPNPVGSSSSSAILLELLRNSTAPAGIILGEIDAILVLGSLVAEEIDVGTIPMMSVEKGVWEALAGKDFAELEVTRAKAFVRTYARRYTGLLR